MKQLWCGGALDAHEVYVHLLICYSVDSSGRPRAGVTTVILRVWLLQVILITIASSFPSVMLGQLGGYTSAAPLPGLFTSTPPSLSLGQTQHKKEMGVNDSSNSFCGSPGDCRLQQLM